MKSDTVSNFPPSICHELIGPCAMIFGFLMTSFKPTFSLSTVAFIKRLWVNSASTAPGETRGLRLLSFLSPSLSQTLNLRRMVSLTSSQRDSAPAPLLLLNICVCSGEKEGWELNPTESQFRQNFPLKERSFSYILDTSPQDSHFLSDRHHSSVVQQQSLSCS